MSKAIFIEFCDTLEKISLTTKRLEIQDILANYLSKLIDTDLESFPKAVVLLNATPFPEYYNKELGVGESTIIAVISESTGKPTKSIKAEYATSGDLGIIAMKYKVAQLFVSKQKLTVAEVYSTLRQTAKESGKNSLDVKKKLLLSLISKSSSLETKYLIRLFEEKLKIGLAVKTILISLAQVFQVKRDASICRSINLIERCEENTNEVPKSLRKHASLLSFVKSRDGNSQEVERDIFTNKKMKLSNEVDKEINMNKARKSELTSIEENRCIGSNTNMNEDNTKRNAPSTGDLVEDYKEVANPVGIVKAAYNRQPDLEKLAIALLMYDIRVLASKYTLQPGIPIKPMLSQPAKNLTMAFKRVEDATFTCEYKYDGERVQIHKFGAKFKIFSRNSEDQTEKYPDLYSKEVCESNDFIIDGEVVAYDHKQKKILPFQTLATRKRKDVKISEIKVEVCVFIFDILYYNGRDLLDLSLMERRRVLQENIKFASKFYHAEYLNCKNADEVEEFFNKAVKHEYEGIIIKLMDSPYLPSQRSNSWIKLKKDYLNNTGDSLDLVVLGAYYGKGRRTGNYGGFILGVYNEDNGTYETICKIGTGFDDSTLKILREQLNALIAIKVPENYIYKDTITIPDVWIKPEIVWEVKAAGFSLSPIYSAGSLNENKGVSLRFPRFIRERPDKKPTEASSVSQIFQMYSEENENGESDFFN